jgi:Pyruvate/2-oxoacid:ferredoxin oxidoreductase delta subunit
LETREGIMKITRKIIKIDEEKCDGCGLCVPSCAEGAIRIVDGKARLVAEKYCDGLGACLGECPRDALEVVDAEVEAFDEEAAREHVKNKGAAVETTLACGCPSTLMQSFAAQAPQGCPSSRIQSFAPQAPLSACEKANIPTARAASGVSALTHWPVQIRLVPPTAPFLRGADLLVAADCVPVAYARFHDDLLRGKTVLVGCPKFDDTEAYIDKFAAIFAAAAIRSVTVVVMEVPCCQGLPVIVRKGMEQAGREIPIEIVTITARGEIR